MIHENFPQKAKIVAKDELKSHLFTLRDHCKKGAERVRNGPRYKKPTEQLHIWIHSGYVSMPVYKLKSDKISVWK